MYFMDVHVHVYSTSVFCKTSMILYRGGGLLLVLMCQCTCTISSCHREYMMYTVSTMSI